MFCNDIGARDNDDFVLLKNWTKSFNLDLDFEINARKRQSMFDMFGIFQKCVFVRWTSGFLVTLQVL